MPGQALFRSDGRGRALPRPGSVKQPPLPGGSITLTIDITYQAILEEEIAKAVIKEEADRGLGILIDPQTGEIFAIAALPGFNPNHSSTSEPDRFRSAVATDMYEPGSTFKIVTATAALERELFEPDDIIFCEEGHITIYDKTIHDAKRFGWLTFDQVFIQSSNVGVIKVAQAVGARDLYHYARAYGFGTKTGINLEGETPGILRDLSAWSGLSLPEVSIGYEVSVSPLQLAYAYAAVANGGYLLQPQIIKSVKDPEGNLIYADAPKVIRKVASEKTMERLRQILRLVVVEGTGKEANIAGFDVAGKSGTAQKIGPDGFTGEHIGSFVGFFPAEDAAFLCLVLLDNPRGPSPYGGTVAAPVVRRIFARIANSAREFSASRRAVPIERRSLPAVDISLLGQTSEEQRPAVLPVSAQRTYEKHADESLTMPDVRGLSLREAVRALTQLGLELRIRGTGIVAEQSPSPREALERTVVCYIILQQPE